MKPKPLHRLFPRYYAWWHRLDWMDRFTVFYVLASCLIIACVTPPGLIWLLIAPTYAFIVVLFIRHIRRQPLP